jgi:putative colanic acid biosynthesis acetyltransferase WcaF
MTRLQDRHLGLSNKAARAIWACAYWLLYRPSPVPLHAWRAMVLRVFGARVGKGALIYPSARIWAPWNLTLGNGSCLGRGVDCYCVDKVEIMDRAMVSQRAFLCTASHDYNRPGLPLVAAPIRLEADAWVTAETYVGPGVTLAEGAVALARAVVVRDVDAWTVVAGNPARAIGSRQRTH